jgi:Fic family protein
MRIGLYTASDAGETQLAAVEAAHARLLAAGLLGDPIAWDAARRAALAEGVSEAGALTSGSAVPAPPALDSQAAANLALGLDYVETLARGAMPLTERLVRILHAVVMRGLPADGEPGVYRTTDLRDTPYPTPRADDVVAAMGAFGRWLAQPDAPPGAAGRPLLRAAYAHARLLAVRPFSDGTGRTAHLLQNLILLRAGYPPIAFPAAERARYNRSVEAAAVHDDLTAFATLTCEAAARALALFEPPTP